MKTYQKVVAAAAISVLSSLGIAGVAQAAVTATVDASTGSLTTSGTVRYTFPKVDGAYVNTPVGTTSYSATIVVNGVTRTYIVMRPDPAPANAPVVLLLHPNGTSPQAMANLTQVGPYVLTQGFWAVMPAAIDGKWHDDPSNSADDDVQFISALIDALVAQGVDGSRIYAAGYSNGGFMTERLACELSDKIAAFSIDAATLRTGLESACQPAVQRPKQYFLGTSDFVVPYNGIANLMSADNTINFWVAQQGCGGTVASTFPQTSSKDKTNVQLTDYTGCTSGQDLRLYTVYGGGHAWPGGLTQWIGITTQDVDATGLVWSFSSAYHL